MSDAILIEEARFFHRAFFVSWTWNQDLSLEWGAWIGSPLLY